MQAINDTLYSLPGRRGFGTFFWEPTRAGAWGSGLFTWTGTDCKAVPGAFAAYEPMKVAYAGRL